MPSLFFEKIKAQKLKTPTQRGFKLASWHAAWSDVGDVVTQKDKNIYKSGIIINELLLEVRSEIGKLYKRNAPKTSNKQLLQAYIAISNRDRYLASKSECVTEGQNLFSVTNNNNMMGNDITLQEISDGAVDGVETAISVCIGRIEKNINIAPGKAPLDIVDFVIKEAHLSQLFAIYESYWHAILWKGYELSELDENDKVYSITQPVNSAEIGGLVSHMRKARLGAQSAMISTSPYIMSLFNEDKYIKFDKVGKKKIIKSIAISKSPDIHQRYNSDWRVKAYDLIGDFSEESITSAFNNGFSINECLNIFRLLMLLSHSADSNYPSDNSFFNIKKLSEFCPTIKKIELVKGLVNATDYSFQKVNLILGFLEYSNGSNKDLWCHPIVPISESEYGLMTSALLTPVILRVVEHWMVTLGIELQSKGDVFEGLILKELNESVAGNNYITDYDKAVSKEIKLPGGKEEVDLLLRIGNTILIGEAKSIITTDSPISEYRTIKTLEHAAKQVTRKVDFIKNNLELTFDRLGWTFKSESDYVLSGFIINSGRMHVGFEIAGIPVCDEKILNKYFNSDFVPLISTGADGEEHLAWFNLYDDFSSLERNIPKYIGNPPQISENKDHFKHNRSYMPNLNASSNKLIIKRLIPKEVTARERLDAEYVFPLHIVDDIDEKIADIAYTI